MSAAYAGPVPCGRCGVTLDPQQGEHAHCVCGAQVRVFRFAPFRVRETGAPPAVLGLLGVDTPCAYHAGNAASEACRRCGSFICGLCALRVASGSYCPPCFERLRGTGELAALRARQARPHAQALALGLLANLLPFMGVLLAPVVFWLAVRALRRREELGERERFVVFKAVLALLLGVLSLVAVVLLVALFVKERPE